jgi:hypothetical protein
MKRPNKLEQWSNLRVGQGASKGSRLRDLAHGAHKLLHLARLELEHDALVAIARAHCT